MGQRTIHALANTSLLVVDKHKCACQRCQRNAVRTNKSPVRDLNIVYGQNSVTLYSHNAMLQQMQFAHTLELYPAIALPAPDPPESSLFS